MGDPTLTAGVADDETYLPMGHPRSYNERREKDKGEELQ